VDVNQKYYFVIFLVTLSTAVFYNANAQQCTQICVAKQFYEEGETIIVSGKVDVVLQSTPIIIQIFRNQTLVTIAQEEVAQDGSYTATFKAEGIYWRTDGRYTIKATYGPSGVYETNFDYQTKEAVGTTTNIFEVSAGSSGTFDIPFTIRGGTIKNILVDQAILGLIVTIESNTDGSLILDLGREWIDAKKSDGTDDTYIILIDGLEVPYQETASDKSRILTIQFQEGDSDIEIIGTKVIPEFGPIAVIILMSAIASAIIISKRTSLQFS
jgi:predicted secreted protein with PEFG-CTERM motif